MSGSVVPHGTNRRRWAITAGLGLIGVILLAGCSSSSSGGGSKGSVGSELATAIQLQKQGQLDAAEALYLKVIAAQPSNWYAQYDLGVIAQGRGQAVKALSYYGAALTANPNYVPALYNEATIYATTDPPNAVELYRRVIQLQPHAPTAYLNLGLLENSRGQVKSGTHDLAVAVTQDPTLITKVPKQLRGLVTAKAQTLSATATPSAAATPTAP